LASASQQCALSQCIVCEGVFDVQEHCGVSAALYLSDLPSCDIFLFLRVQNCLRGHHFETTNNVQRAISDVLKDLTEDFSSASRDGRTASSIVLLLKGTALKGFTLKCKNFRDNFFFMKSVSILFEQTTYDISVTAVDYNTDNEYGLNHLTGLVLFRFACCTNLDCGLVL
jgi:hypothetical protein